jgi:hypothetical protein
MPISAPAKPRDLDIGRKGRGPRRIEGDPDRDALHNLGEIAGCIVRRQQRELRA